MNQSQNFVQEKKKISLEYIHSENIYSHDNLFFSDIQTDESWSFLPYQEITSTSLSFLFIRSLLSDSIYQKKIQASDISQVIKAKIAKLGYASYFNSFLDTQPILGLAENTDMPEFIASIFLEDKCFHLTEEQKKFTLFTGGGILKEKKTNAHEMVEKLFSEFKLTNKTGHFFLRTKMNSYLYLLNPENKSKTFYIQQKNSFPVDFQFYHIKTYS
jgi:hypothetical protein